MVQPANPPLPFMPDREGAKHLQRDSTRSREHPAGTARGRVPKEAGKVPLDIALSLLKPDELEKLQKYVVCSLAVENREEKEEKSPNGSDPRETPIEE